MVSICLFPAGYQHRNFIKHFNNWVKACYEREKKKTPLTAHISCLNSKVEKLTVWAGDDKKNKNGMTSSYK